MNYRGAKVFMDMAELVKILENCFFPSWVIHGDPVPFFANKLHEINFSYEFLFHVMCYVLDCQGKVVV